VEQGLDQARKSIVLYTFLKFLGWGLLLTLLGGCIGWALRSLKCRGEIARVRATGVDADELERMRHRLANMDQIVAERNRLRMQVADMRHADSPGVVLAPGEGLADVEDDPGDRDAGVGSAVAELATDDDETAADAGADGDDGTTETASAEAVEFAAIEHDDDTSADASNVDDSDAPDTGNNGAESPDLDVTGAEAVLGKKIRLDDLSVIEGIGPKISELCRGMGIETWRQLADTDVPTLQSMLDDAGSRFQVHKPDTWPTQAGLLAEGRWAAFKEYLDSLDSGR
jgi:predicted flap endonuclease-1-like 5' DNA nuclease